jgi:hypothetical protein
MYYVLAGFSQHGDVRRYSFQGVADDRSRTQFAVTANVQTARKFNIKVQELPLLCAQLLESTAPTQAQSIVLSEKDMRNHAALAAAAAEKHATKKRPSVPGAAILHPPEHD